MSGDYEFLCALYEMSGASGRYMHLGIHKYMLPASKYGSSNVFFAW